MKANQVKAKPFKFVTAAEQHKRHIRATGTVVEGVTGVTVLRSQLQTFTQAIRWDHKWLYEGKEHNYFCVHKSYPCRDGHWMKDSFKTWQLLWIMCKRHPSEGKEHVCLKPMTLQWITFLEIKDQQKSLNSLLKILYFFLKPLRQIHISN